jgi:hypothetical protein
MLPLALLLAVNLAPETPGIRYQQPQMATRGDMVGLTFASGNTVYFTSSMDGGKSFLPPEKVSDKGVLSLGAHRGPRVCFQAGAIAISAVVGQKGRGQDGDLVVWTSSDDGVSWSTGTRVNDVEGSAREGLHGMACGNGWVVLSWLDLRTKKTQLYGAMSLDGGKTWDKNFLIYESADGSICECCHPSVAVGWGGAIHVMFRNALAGSRDMYLATATDGGKTWNAAKIGRGTWKINACPMDGGQVGIAPNGRPVTVWRRENRIFFARPDSDEAELGAGKDPSIASNLTNELYAVWTGSDGVYLRTSKMSDPKLIAPGGSYPFALFHNGIVLAAWESGGGITVEKLP